MAFVTASGTQLAVFEAGAGDPPFVFVHGWACDHSFWAPQFADLQRDHRCLAIDLRGRGESPAVPPYDSTTAADDVAAVVRALGVGPAIVAGHSLGGLIALLLNDRHGELVTGIVLGDSPLTGAGQGGFADGARRVREAGTMAVMRGYVEGFFVEATPPAVREKVLGTMLSCPAEVGAGMLSNDEVFVDRLTALLKKADEKPLMAIWAERPLGNPERLRELLMFVRQEPIAGAGHFFQLEQPAITNALLRAFVDDVERDPRLQRR
ncbi:MAG: alpha/beta hydrolase [Gemmataceae bacterium]|nr:alpha/beta hydrolase [Gemmataceae bacterium]